MLNVDIMKVCHHNVLHIIKLICQTVVYFTKILQAVFAPKKLQTQTVSI